MAIMAEIIIFGASDDLIEVRGSIVEEFSYYSTNWELTPYVAVSDGTLLRVRYDEDGIWRFTPIVVGSADVDIKHGLDDRTHSDIVTMTGEEDLTWVALVAEVAKRRS
jgi:hypothetical protein